MEENYCPCKAHLNMNTIGPLKELIKQEIEPFLYTAWHLLHTMKQFLSIDL